MPAQSNIQSAFNSFGWGDVVAGCQFYWHSSNPDDDGLYRYNGTEWVLVRVPAAYRDGVQNNGTHNRIAIANHAQECQWGGVFPRGWWAYDPEYGTGEHPAVVQAGTRDDHTYRFHPVLGFVNYLDYDGLHDVEETPAEPEQTPERAPDQDAINAQIMRHWNTCRELYPGDGFGDEYLLDGARIAYTNIYEYRNGDWIKIESRNDERVSQITDDRRLHNKINREYHNLMGASAWRHARDGEIVTYQGEHYMYHSYYGWVTESRYDTLLTEPEPSGDDCISNWFRMEFNVAQLMQGARCRYDGTAHEFNGTEWNRCVPADEIFDRGWISYAQHNAANRAFRLENPDREPRQGEQIEHGFRTSRFDVAAGWVRLGSWNDYMEAQSHYAIRQGLEAAFHEQFPDTPINGGMRIHFDGITRQLDHFMNWDDISNAENLAITDWTTHNAINLAFHEETGGRWNTPTHGFHASYEGAEYRFHASMGWVTAARFEEIGAPQDLLTDQYNRENDETLTPGMRTRLQDTWYIYTQDDGWQRVSGSHIEETDLGWNNWVTHIRNQSTQTLPRQGETYHLDGRTLRYHPDAGWVGSETWQQIQQARPGYRIDHPAPRGRHTLGTRKKINNRNYIYIGQGRWQRALRRERRVRHGEYAYLSSGLCRWSDATRWNSVRETEPGRDAQYVIVSDGYGNKRIVRPCTRIAALKASGRYEELPPAEDSHSNPNDQVVTFGVELEFNENYDNMSEIADYLQENGLDIYNTGSYGHSRANTKWELKTDSSCGLELASPVYKSTPEGMEQFIRDAQIIAQTARENGWETNQDCGMHVHVHCAKRKVRRWLKILKKLDNAFFDMQPNSRQDHHYCMRINSSYDRATQGNSIQDLLRGAASLSRTYGANVSHLGRGRMGTVEFRHAAGTLNARKIIAWVMMCVGIGKYANSSATISLPKSDARNARRKNLRRAVNMIKYAVVSAETEQWAKDSRTLLKERAAEFNGVEA